MGANRGGAYGGGARSRESVAQTLTLVPRRAPKARCWTKIGDTSTAVCQRGREPPRCLNYSTARYLATRATPAAPRKIIWPIPGKRVSVRSAKATGPRAARRSRSQGSAGPAGDHRMRRPRKQHTPVATSFSQTVALTPSARGLHHVLGACSQFSEGGVRTAQSGRLVRASTLGESARATPIDCGRPKQQPRGLWPVAPLGYWKDTQPLT